MAEAAPEQLREAIILGELTPGTPLRLEDLARTLGMSISPIREAVRQLEAHGLAEHVPHHGAKVTGLDVEELRELFSIRLALESMAVRRAAELFSADDEQRARARLAPVGGARQRGGTRPPVGTHTHVPLAPFQPTSTSRCRRLPAPAGCWGRSGRPGTAASAIARSCSERARSRTVTRSSTSSCSKPARRTLPLVRWRRCGLTSSSRARYSPSSCAA